MLKNLKTIVVAILLCMLGLLFACSSDEEETIETTNYIVKSTQTEYQCNVGEYFTLPKVWIEDEEGNEREGYEITYSVSDETGVPQVIKDETEKKFLVANAGVYKLRCYVSGYEEIEELTIFVTGTLQTISALTDVAIDYATGTISFTEMEDANYILFVNNEEIGQVENGSRVSSWLDVGDNTMYVVVDKGVGYERSEKSNVLNVHKLSAPQDVQIMDGIMTFSEEAGYTYQLYNGSLFKRTIHSGEDLNTLEVLEFGLNELFIVATGTGDVLSSDGSLVLSFFYHNVVEDLQISTTGELSFTDNAAFGFTYDLYLRDNATDVLLVSNIRNAERVYAQLDESLKTGTNELYVKVNTTEEMNLVCDGENTLEIQRLAPVSDLSVENEIVCFEDDSAERWKLYIDDEDCDFITTGTNLTDLFTAPGEVKIGIKAWATQDGFWNSFASEISYDVPRLGAFCFIYDESSKAYSNVTGGAPELTGARLVGANNAEFVYDKTVDITKLSGNFIEFTADKVDGVNYGSQIISVKLTDVDDADNVIELKFGHNLLTNVNNKQSAIYYKDEEKARDIDENWTGMTLNGASLAAQLHTITWSFDYATKVVKLSNVLSPSASTYTFTDLTGFENGAKISIQVGTAETAIIVSEIAGEYFYPMESSRYFEAQYGVKMKDGVTGGAPNLTGTRLVGANNAEFVYDKVVDVLEWNGDFIELTADTLDGENFGGQTVTIKLTDVDDADNVIELKFGVNLGVTNGNVQSAIYYKGERKAYTADESWNYSMANAKKAWDADLGKEVRVAADKTFKGKFVYSTKEISFCSTKYVLTDLTGFENGAKISVQVGTTETAVIVTGIAGESFVR